ncbi:MAG: hypothetical protein AVO33_05060 [delta proteobacterium ML8_F1]|nr:MAG: hypothetical protein AVO33_05060 [delta proteobacterium ML8_F1]
MIYDAFRDYMIKSLTNNYDIESPYSVEDWEFDFYGHFYARNSKYLMSKKLEYYSYSNYDHLFYKTMDTVTRENLEQLLAMTKRIVDFYSKIDEEHMETYITYFLIAKESPSAETVSYLKRKTNYLKNFAFGLNGWTKLKIVILVPASKEVYTNRFGNRDKKNFQEILENFKFLKEGKE